MVVHPIKSAAGEIMTLLDAETAERKLQMSYGFAAADIQLQRDKG